MIVVAGTATIKPGNLEEAVAQAQRMIASTEAEALWKCVAPRDLRFYLHFPLC